MRRTCNYDCFNCRYKDCIVSCQTITYQERVEANSLDKQITSSDAVEASIRDRRAYKLKYYHEHKEEAKNKAYREKYRQEHREQMCENSKKYYYEHKKEIDERHLANFYANHEENKKKNRDRKRERYHANLEESRQKQRDYRARKRKEKEDAYKNRQQSDNNGND